MHSCGHLNFGQWSILPKISFVIIYYQGYQVDDAQYKFLFLNHPCYQLFSKRNIHQIKDQKFITAFPFFDTPQFPALMIVIFQSSLIKLLVTSIFQATSGTSALYLIMLRWKTLVTKTNLTNKRTKLVLFQMHEYLSTFQLSSKQSHVHSYISLKERKRKQRD